jgi:hypothetical protein
MYIDSRGPEEGGGEVASWAGIVGFGLFMWGFWPLMYLILYGRQPTDWNPTTARVLETEVVRYNFSSGEYYHSTGYDVELTVEHCVGRQRHVAKVRGFLPHQNESNDLAEEVASDLRQQQSVEVLYSASDPKRLRAANVSVSELNAARGTSPYLVAGALGAIVVGAFLMLSALGS